MTSLRQIGISLFRGLLGLQLLLRA